MTIEELFTEEYKKLKAENEKLKSWLNIMREDYADETRRKLELYDFMRSLKLRIRKSSQDGTKYITIGNSIICEGEEFFTLASEFAKKEDEVKKEDK